MESNVLTLKDLAIQLDLPESTLRKYRDAFAQYIPTVGSGRDRRYTQDAADVFAAIRDCRTKEHLSWEDTSKELAKRFPVDAASIDKHGLPVPDRVPVSAQAAAILRRLESANEDTAFILNTIGAEIINISKMMQRQGTAFDDIGIIRRSIYNQDKDLRDILLALRQLLENTPVQQAGQIKAPDDQSAVMGQLARLQSSMAYLVRHAEKRPAPEPAAPPALASQDTAILKKEIARLCAQLKEKEDEIAQMQTTNRRLKMENQALKTRLADMSRLDDSDQTATESFANHDKPTGGKFFFRGKKK